MAPLRIFHVLTHGNVTRGGAIQALLIARGQARAGHEVTVICNGSPAAPIDPTFEPWTEDGVRIIPFDLGLAGYENLREMLRFRRFLRDRAPDVMHVHRDTALVFAWLATLGARPAGDKPFAFVSQRGTTHGFRSSLIERAHRSPRVHKVIGVARAVTDALATFGVDRRKLEVVYGSCDLEKFDREVADRDAVRAELGLRDDQPLIVQVGELHKKKAPDVFVKAAQRILAVMPHCVFALVGKGARERKMRALIDRYGIGASVKLLGFRSDVPNVYAAADVAVNSSIRDEGLTGALREALAMACPTVATNTDGNPELVRDGETGILVERGNPDALALGIMRILRDPERGRAMGERGRRLVLELMDPALRLARTEEIYRSVLENRAVREISARRALANATT
jgi:L-malate glycosyltransferase